MSARPARTCLAAGVLAFGAAAVEGCSAQKAAESPAPAAEAREMSVTSESASGGNAAPAPPSEAGTTDAAPPATAEEAARQLDDAEKALGSLFAPRTSPSNPSSPEPLAAEGRCVDVCRALESMKRARDHVCKLAEGEPSRCTSANERVERARARAVAACPTCS